MRYKWQGKTGDTPPGPVLAALSSWCLARRHSLPQSLTSLRLTAFERVPSRRWVVSRGRTISQMGFSVNVDLGLLSTAIFVGMGRRKRTASGYLSLHAEEVYLRALFKPVGSDLRFPGSPGSLTILCSLHALTCPHLRGHALRVPDLAPSVGQGLRGPAGMPTQVGAWFPRRATEVCFSPSPLLLVAEVQNP